jgi:ribosome-binding protein aMBF1 (putative translation factor)
MKCFNYDICQSCFFLGTTSKKHKIDHPTQEYCQSASSKDNTKAILKTMRNNVSKKYKKKVNRPRYLPIIGTETGEFDEDL